jgi:hypothetical protein
MMSAPRCAAISPASQFREVAEVADAPVALRAQACTAAPQRPPDAARRRAAPAAGSSAPAAQTTSAWAGPSSSAASTWPTGNTRRPVGRSHRQKTARPDRPQRARRCSRSVAGDLGPDACQRRPVLRAAHRPARRAQPPVQGRLASAATQYAASPASDPCLRDSATTGAQGLVPDAGVARLRAPVRRPWLAGRIDGRVELATAGPATRRAQPGCDGPRRRGSRWRRQNGAHTRRASACLVVHRCQCSTMFGAAPSNVTMRPRRTDSVPAAIRRRRLPCPAYTAPGPAGGVIAASSLVPCRQWATAAARHRRNHRRTGRAWRRRILRP